jgi:two-component system response regulator RegA
METKRVVCTVLFVDDDERLLATYKSCVERAGVSRAFTATTREAAIALAAEHHPDVCVVDLQLGCESGLDLIRELRAADPGVALVLISGYGCMQTGADAVRAGADHVLAKPVTLSEIMACLAGAPAPAVDTASLDRAIFEHMQRVLGDCAGNRSEAARRLRVDRGTLQRWLDRPAPR